MKIDEIKSGVFRDKTTKGTIKTLIKLCSFNLHFNITSESNVLNFERC